MNEVYIYDAVRTPRGRGKQDGALHTSRPIHLAYTVLEALVHRNRLDTSRIDDVILGCVTPVGEQGGNLAKAAALYAKYDDKVCGVTINRFCASGLEAVNYASSSIMSGYMDFMVAGGVESMSRVPMGSDGGAWISDPDVTYKTSFIPQGISADLIATLKGFSREDVDRFALTSQKKANQATVENRFKKSLIPVKDILDQVLLEKDEHIRPETTLEGLSQLRPAFAQMGTEFGFDTVAMLRYPEVEKINHVHHAGNSSGIVDGAAAVLLGNKEIGKQLNLTPRARIRSYALQGTDATIMLTGPIPATLKALKHAKLSIKDIDLIEINEAFSSVCLNFMQELNISPEIVNVNGGAIALGHPLGATGAMLIGTVLDELERQDKSLGLVTLCVGGGMGITTIIERV